jgi:hypothetical protein
MQRRQNVDALHNGITEENFHRMLRKAGLLTRPTLAHRDAPCPKQGRSEQTGKAYASVR